ncbi:hypothetical protein GBO14_05585 [Pseudoalteromonas shioyasakiensis]|uniref:hypothetical protein n=1 Tax=Pseudoalteromonas shioyasakiensis TaxID=1190813 RepID=UPI002095206D|nr:hypothetical protein [Pseudoalteromonas shioyasakiensis]MCO6354221.1 hypothetical protein [Pseudoalteromonas shioyasakiensis]
MELITYRDDAFQQLAAQVINNHEGSLEPFYLPINTAYYQEYYNDNRSNISFCVSKGNKAYLLVFICEAKEKRFDYFNFPIKFLWCKNIDEPTRKGATSLAIKHLNQLLNGNKLDYQESVSYGLSSFATHLLKIGYKPNLLFQQIINLTFPETVLFSNLRKVYRANVRWGEKNIVFKIINSNSIYPGIMKDFKALHIFISGKETRSSLTWQLQEEMIEKGEAFAVLGFLNNELISASLFPFSKSECYYGVGAYRRDLFSKPISHSSIWNAITYAKQIGCKTFSMGEAYFDQLNTDNSKRITDKELSIAHFKQGFGGVITPVLRFESV